MFGCRQWPFVTAVCQLLWVSDGYKVAPAAPLESDTGFVDWDRLTNPDAFINSERFRAKLAEVAEVRRMRELREWSGKIHNRAQWLRNQVDRRHLMFCPCEVPLAELPAEVARLREAAVSRTRAVVTTYERAGLPLPGDARTILARPPSLALVLDECHRCGASGVARVRLRRVVGDRPWRAFALCTPCADDAAADPGWRLVRVVTP